MKVKPFVPYVGVSGVVSPLQQSQLQLYAEAVGLFGAGRRVAFGVKATHKTQYLRLPNKYGPEWYPVGEDIGRALSLSEPGGSSLNVVQVFLEPSLVGHWHYREAFLNGLLARTVCWIDALQFDMLPWHVNTGLLDWLWQIKRDFGLQVFLQVHAPAMEKLLPDEVATRLNVYSHALDCVLFDASHGTGKPMNTAKLREYLGAARQQLPDHVGLAIAGGLHAQAVREQLPKLLDDFPNLSWDAEGRLHPTSVSGTQPLSLAEAQAYLEESARVLD